MGEVVEFAENAIYTTKQAAKILQRDPQTVRRLCSTGMLAAQRDRGGYFITGWAIRAYAEGRCTLNAEGGMRNGE